MMQYSLSGGVSSEWKWLESWGKIAGNYFHRRQQISIALVGSTVSRRLNRHYRGKDKPTDVLSFRLARTAKEALLGELIICRAVAARQARQHNHSIKRELQILVIHGTLHLLGYDHEKEKEALAMEALEAKLLKKLLTLPKT